MLRLEQDREDYGALLKAPEGFALEAAVGTTYSLQLEPFTLAMISLGLGEDTDSFLKDNPVGMLKAIQYVTDKVVIFHEAGQILVDRKNKNNKLYPLLEKTIVPVALEAKEGESLYPAFHPKMWLLSYVNPSTNEKSYRFIVMSRNLTYDRSWDVAVAFDGIRYSSQVKNSKPIADFLGFLKEQINEDDANYDRKHEILENLQKEVKYVEFETDKYCDLTVMPMGIGSKNYSVENDKYLASDGDPFHELVIFSPFVSASVIGQFNDRQDLPKGTKRNLIIRDSEIKKLGQKDISKFDGIWSLKSNIISGEDGLSDEDTEKQKQDIHAKIFMFSRENKSVLYFGSMNASHRAFYTNVELDVRLDWYNTYMGPSKFLEELGISNDKNNPFEQIDPEDFAEEAEEDIKDADSKLEQAIKRLCRLSGKATVTKNESDNYNIDVLFSDIVNSEETSFTIQPLCHNQALHLGPVLKFTNVELENLSEFYVVTANGGTGSDVSRIITIPTEGIPESRDKKLFNLILDDKRKFFEYISFILSDDAVGTALENESSDGGFTENNGSYRIENNVALYEKMLEAALHHSERLEEIESAIKMLPEENELQKDFIPLYKTFMKALNKE